jgi:stalled ribosome alternative rescue factor ArfA
MIESEQIFLQQLTQISKGLVHPKAVNALLAAMLYFPPGTMRIPDARNRLPHWLIGDYEQVFETEAAVKSDSSSDLLAQYIQSPQFANQLLGCVNLYRIDPSDESVVLELRQIRKQMADFWLTVPSEKLENFYRGGVGKGYQAILKCGLQAEAMTEAEQKFLQRLTEISKGLVQPQAINALLGAMLYFVPGKMRVPDARTRLPQWLLEDYEKVFESAFATTEQTVVKQDYLPQFLNQLTAAVNLYEIDPTAELVIADLRQIRKQIADLWLSVSGEQVEVLYRSDFGKGYKAMLGSGFINEPLHESDREFFNSLVVELSKGFGAPKAVNNLLAAMLYCRPGQLRVQDANTCLPPWLLADYEQFVGGAIELAVK